MVSKEENYALDGKNLGVNDADNKNGKIAAEEKSEKLPYPKAAFFVVANELCERFSYYGMRTVLSLYLTDYLLFSESIATVIYHGFVTIAYLLTVFGAVLADSVWGKYKTVLYLSTVYAFGSVLLSTASITPLGLPHRTFSLLGLLLIAIGTGGMKPSIISFGADQFVLPQQKLQLAAYFSLFYFMISLGSLTSSTVTPILREYVHCLEEDSCYPLAFGVPALLMIAAIVIFWCGKPLYKIVPPEENLMIKLCKCIGNAVRLKIKTGTQKKDHWLDYSLEKYGTELVDEIKAVLRVLCMFLPIPLFWALSEQSGSTWVFQARQMNGNIGFYTILPDQMQVVETFVYLACIPFFQYIVYPIFEKLNFLKRPLQKIVAGGVLLAASFVISAFISLSLESTSSDTTASQIRIYNTLPCGINVSSNSSTFTISEGGYYKNTLDLSLKGNETYSFTVASSCANFSNNFSVYEEYSVGCYFKNSEAVFFLDDLSKEAQGLPRVRTLVNSNGYYDNYTNVSYTDSDGDMQIQTNVTDITLYDINSGTYTIQIANTTYQHKFQQGGVYTVLATGKNVTYFDVNIIEVTSANTLHILWQLPQIVLLNFGGVMFTIPGLEFAYSEAPVSMKAIILAGWMLTTSFGNLIVVIIELINLFEISSYNFFLYAALMLADVGVLVILAMKYEYRATKGEQ